MKIRINEAIELVRGEFSDIEGMFEADGRFLINKNDLTREDIIHRLKGIFSDTVIEGGRLVVSATILGFTKFAVEKAPN
jgi:hypothetical protein